MLLLFCLEQVDPAGVPKENLARLGGYPNLRLELIQLFVSRVNGSLKFLRKYIEVISYCHLLILMCQPEAHWFVKQTIFYFTPYKFEYQKQCL